MASSTEGGRDVLPDFHTFDNVLKIIPTCQAFMKVQDLPAVTPLDWKKCVLAELMFHLPGNLEQKIGVEPSNQFFNCRKSVYKQSLSVVDFNRNVSEVLGLMDAITASLFQLVEQHPKTGSINRISSLFILSVTLIEVVPWDRFENAVKVNLMKILDQILKDLKTFRQASDRVQANVEALTASTKKVFRAGPYVTEARSPDYGRPSNGNDFGGADSTRIGLTRSGELLVAHGMVKIDKLTQSLQLGLLIMMLQHCKEVLSSTIGQLFLVNHLLKKTKTPKKWNGILSRQLTIFELALLRKSNQLLTNCTAELGHQSLYTNNQSKFLYEMRRPFKVLKQNLHSSGYDAINRHFVMFQIHFQNNSSLKQYIENDCLNEEAANFIIVNFTGYK